MGRRMTIAATALVSLVLAACGADENQVGVPASEAQQAQATPSAEALRAAVELLQERCLTGPVLDEDEETVLDEDEEAVLGEDEETPVQTPAATEIAVDEVIRAFYLVDDRSSAEEDVREALGVLEGCASSATARRLAVATGVEADDERLAADGRPEAGGDGAYDCDAQGINAIEGQGGTCVSARGQRVTVADRGQTATTPAMEVELRDVETSRSLREGKKTRRATGVFVLLTLEVRNRLKEPVEFHPGVQVELHLEGLPYFSFDKGTTTIDPGEKTTGTVAFDVPEDVADGLDSNGNVFVFPFAEAGQEGDQATIAVLRTYK
ncbi:MAG: DUF4352 domain-containing protein [Actinomycetota bacterium]|nr:DUF4352 domain-containing protein [Actinomycetota bacterium]